MTHTLHRAPGRTGLDRDLVFLCTPARGVNTDGAAARLARVLDILHQAGPANIGFYDCRGRASLEEARRSLHDHSRLRCVFDDAETLAEVLRRVAREDAGLSVAVTGPLEQVVRIAREAGLEPHTVNLSLGVFGRTERLPADDVLEVSTMCGHGLISFRLVEMTLAEVRAGATTVDEAVRRLDRPCTCGLVNPTRLRQILEAEAAEGAPREPRSR